MATRQDIDTIQQIVSDYNNGDMESLWYSLSPRFFNHVPAYDELDGTEVFYGLLKDIRAASSDLVLSIEDLRIEGDVLRGRMAMNGRHDGPIWGVPPTGNSFEMTADIAIRVVDERYAPALENLAPPQIIAFLRQVELVPERMDLPPEHPVAFPEIVFKVIFTGQVADKPCSHLDMIKVTEPTSDVCQQCVETGDEWPALRMCLTCGFVGCCDTSVSKHMKAHYEATGHPLFRSIRMEEGWVWCYEDNAFFERRTIERMLGK